jgi:hypothetical protein
MLRGESKDSLRERRAAIPEFVVRRYAQKVWRMWFLYFFACEAADLKQIGKQRAHAPR